MHRFTNENFKYSHIIFGAALPHAELVVTQAVALREYVINRALLQSLGGNSPLYVGLPKAWLQIISEKGFNINFLVCNLLWIVTILKNFMLGCRQIFFELTKLALYSLKESKQRCRYVYFSDLTRSCLPQLNASLESRCVINWYLRWQDKPDNIQELCHDVEECANALSLGGVKLSFCRSPYPYPTGAVYVAKYIIWAIQAITLAAFSMLRGRWWHSLLLAEAAKAAVIRLSDGKNLALQYLFPNSRSYPPLWTYELNASKSEILFYFYSTNNNVYPIGTKNALLSTRLSLLNWPNYLVWSKTHAAFIKDCDKRGAAIKEAGPIWFSDNEMPVPQTTAPTIAVFPVQPQRLYRYCLLGLPFEYYVPEVAKRFLKDIADAASAVEARVYFKNKRNIQKLAHPSVRMLCDSLAGRDNFSIIDPDTSAFRVIEKADIVVSMPFTSTALAAHQIGKPSIYYDPMFSIASDDPSAHGIQIIRGFEALKAWLLIQVNEVQRSI